MPHGLHRVRVDRLLPGCEDLYPPYQPADADSEFMVARLPSMNSSTNSAWIRILVIHPTKMSSERGNFSARRSCSVLKKRLRKLPPSPLLYSL